MQRPDPVCFQFEGRDVSILSGDTIAAALTRASIHVLRRSRRGTPRGLYCGIGLCHECRVTLVGSGTVRACVTPARPGMRVRTSR